MSPRRSRPVHLAYKKGTACGGQSQAVPPTKNLTLVTCQRCIRSIHMADAEARAMTRKDRA